MLNVQGLHDFRQMVTQMTEPLVSESSLVKVEIAIGKLKRYKSPGTNQILAELIKAGGETLHSEIHRLIRPMWNKEELPQQYQFMRRVIRLTVIIIEESPSYQLPTNFYPTFFWQG
jgi:hypothetical protein